jgi:hypothetical protein
LEKAALARKARSALLAEVKSGTTSVAGVFGRSGEELVKKTRVVQVLRAVPGYGPAKVAALMAVSGVDEKGLPVGAERPTGLSVTYFDTMSLTRAGLPDGEF